MTQPQPDASDRATAPFTAIGGLLALAGAMGIGRFVYTPILPFMAEAIPLTPAEGGLVASANFLGYLAGALLAAVPGLPGRQRTWLVAGLAVSGLTSMAMSFAGSLAAFAALRFTGGLASAFVFVFATALVLDRLARHGRPGLSALHFSGVGIGIAFSSVLVAALAAGGAGGAGGAGWPGLWQGLWPELWQASGVATFVFLAGAALLLRDEPAGARPAAASPATSQPKATSPRRAMKPAVLRLILAYGLFGLGYVITATFVSVIARGTPGLAGTEMLVWLIVGLTAAPSILLWNAIARRIGAARAFALAALLEAIGVVLSVTSHEPAGILIAAALLGGTFMGITALGLIEARRQAAGDPRSLLAAMTASFGLGQMLGPSLAGYGAAATGSFLLPSLAAAACLLVSGALVLVPARPLGTD